MGRGRQERVRGWVNTDPLEFLSRRILWGRPHWGVSVPGGTVRETRGPALHCRLRSLHIAMPRLGSSMPPTVEHPLFFLDYDGTLAPIVDDPAAAVPHPDVPELLQTLDERYPLWIVTGRDIAALSSFLDQPLRAIGLHGAQRGVVGGDVEHLMPDDAAQALHRLRRSLPSVDGVQIEEKDQAFAVHYREVEDGSAARDRLRSWLDAMPEMLDAIWGKKVVELRPAGLTKGTAVRRIAEKHPGHTPVYLGDDTTDEDAFEALQEMNRETVTVRIGPEETRAEYRLAGPDEVAEYLRRYV